MNLVPLSKRSVRMAGEAHPLSVCLAVLSHAVWTMSPEELNKAIANVRRLYLEQIVSPTEIAYLLGVVLPITYGLPSRPHLGFEWTELDNYRRMVQRIARETFGGVPLDGTRSQFFFKVDFPLSWLNNRLPGAFFDDTLMTLFLREVVTASTPTLEFLDVILRHSRTVMIRHFLSDRIVSAAGALGRWFVFHQGKLLEKLALENSDRYIGIVEDYVRRMRSMVTDSKTISHAPDVLLYQLNAMEVVDQLLSILLRVIDSEELSVKQQERIAHIAMLAPYLEYHANLSRSRYIHREVLKRALEKNWLRQDIKEQFLPVYQDNLTSQLREFLGSNFSVKGRSRRLMDKTLHSIVRLIVSLIALEPKGTSDTVVSVFKEIPKSGSATYGEVSAARAREKAIRLFSLVLEEQPGLVSQLVPGWMGRNDILDKALTKAYARIVQQLA